MGERIAAGAAEGKPLPVGAYGLQIEGLPGAAGWMAPVTGPGRLSIEVTDGARSPDAARSAVDGDGADLRLAGGGRLRMRRGEDRAVFSFVRRPEQADLLHPYLAPAAALAQMWGGAEAFHAGALATPAGAVLLIGEKEAGKSTTLAWLAAECGVQVLADDLAVVVGREILAGPRCLDLRGPGFYDAGPGAIVRGGGRRRICLAPAPSALPIGAVVVLRWGGREVTLRPVPARERLGQLLRQRMYRALISADLEAILDLAARPMLTLTRSPGPAGLSGAGSALVRYFA